MLFIMNFDYVETFMSEKKNIEAKAIANEQIALKQKIINIFVLLVMCQLFTQL